MKQEKHFHFTLCPVQGFVSQARRIRDFWAGSFLLSWLSAVAMRSVEAQDGIIQFPTYDPHYMDWLSGQGKGKSPEQGGVPNRFVAEVPDGFNGEKVAADVRNVWRELAEKVWENDLANLPKPQRTTTRDIWDRQIKHFWEISWVLTEGKDDKAMDKRKNWRNHMLPTEQGSLCSLMDGWVELSGEKKPGKAAQFWESFREKFGRDLNEREQLCAIAFVKRRFAKVFDQVNLNMEGWICHGWSVQDSRIPSIDDMAAVHWLEHVLKNVDEACLAEIKTAKKELRTPKNKQTKKLGKLIDDHTKKRLHPISCIQQLYIKEDGVFPKVGIFVSRGEVAHFDGGVFFEHALRNSRIYDPENIQAMLNILAGLKNKFGKPSPYYAILLMDGDNMGKALSSGDPQKISRALLEFNKKTAKLVYEHNGFLIYAGGDDVLALLPVEDALNCAYQLHKVYSEVMQGIAESTLSGAIQFAQVKTPLTLLLQDAHQLLDQIAKKKHGRDSLAVRVWSHSGQKLEWAMPWERASDHDKLMLQDLLESFQQDGEQFSNSFFYKIREFFEKDSELDIEVKKALLVSAYRASKEVTVQEAQKQVEKLISQCLCIQRKTKGEGICYERDQRHINPDGALLLRFITSQGVADYGKIQKE